MPWNGFNRLQSSLRRALAGLVAIAASISCAAAQSADDGFNAHVDGGALVQPGVYALAAQDDGKLLIGGIFATVAGQTRTRIARLNADGSLDSTFAATAVDDTVAGLVVQPDRRIIIYGLFSQVGAYARAHIARLNADGTVDAGFDPNPVGATVSRIYAATLQPDGRILVGGVFTSIGGLDRTNIARLNSNGSADSAFSASATTNVRAIAVQADGKVVIGGRFAQVDNVARTRLARLMADGALDTGFAPTLDNSTAGFLDVYHVGIQPDGKILVAGSFTSVNAAPQACIARLLGNGSKDPFYSPDIGCDAANGYYAYAMALQADGHLLVGGDFAAGGSSGPDPHVARIATDGSVDAAFFHLNTDDVVSALAVQADGNILLAGGFANTLYGTGSAAFVVADRPYLIRLNAADGDLQWGQGPGTNGVVYTLATQPDGRIIVGGQFSTLHDWGGGFNPDPAHVNIGRLNSDLTVDSTFAASTDSYVYALALQPDGKILVGGGFTMVDGVMRNHLARLNADGTLDTGFDPNADALVYAIALQPDGSILVGGSFANIGNFSAGGNYHIPYLARLHGDGSVDTSYAPGPDYWVYSIAAQVDGSIVIGGEFANVGVTARANVARLFAGGGLDPGFDPGTGSNGGVSNVLIQPDGKILVGGYFGSFAKNNNLTGLARLNANGSVDPGFDPSSSSSPTCLSLQLDGKILVGGVLYPRGSLTARYFTRLNPNGSIDSAFAPNSDNLVFAMAPQLDGRLMTGGAFTMIGGQSRAGLARLNTPVAALQSLGISGSNVIWTRSGAGTEFSKAPELEFSVSGSLFAPLGPMQRVAGGWTYAGYSPPIGQDFFLRVRTTMPSGYGSTSSGMTESTRWIYVADKIFADGFQ